MNGPAHPHPDTPITNKIIDDADACPETRVVFLIKNLVNKCREFERAAAVPECGTLPRHTDDCAVHSPTLRPCSCGLETKLRDLIGNLSLRLELAKADARTAHLQERELAGTVRSASGLREWQQTLLDTTNALSDRINNTDPYTKIVAQARKLLRDTADAVDAAPVSTSGAHEGFYEKLWKDFVSLQRGDARLLVEDARRWRSMKPTLSDTVDIRIDGQEFTGISNMDAWADARTGVLSARQERKDG